MPVNSCWADDSWEDDSWDPDSWETFGASTLKVLMVCMPIVTVVNA